MVLNCLCYLLDFLTNYATTLTEGSVVQTHCRNILSDIDYTFAIWFIKLIFEVGLTMSKAVCSTLSLRPRFKRCRVWWLFGACMQFMAFKWSRPGLKDFYFLIMRQTLESPGVVLLPLGGVLSLAIGLPLYLGNCWIKFRSTSSVIDRINTSNATSS